MVAHPLGCHGHNIVSLLCSFSAKSCWHFSYRNRPLVSSHLTRTTVAPPGHGSHQPHSIRTPPPRLFLSHPEIPYHISWRLSTVEAAHSLRKRFTHPPYTFPALPGNRLLAVLPYFPQTRPWTLAKLIPFDREAYVAALLAQHNYLPEAFRLWVLEWPARVVFGCVWPGLPSINISDDVADDIEKFWGRNRLCTAQVSDMIWVHRKTNDSASIQREHMPGLLVRSSYNEHTWLILDEREGKRDKVYELADSPTVIRGEGDDYDVVHANWIEFQRATWARIERAASKRASTTESNPITS